MKHKSLILACLMVFGLVLGMSSTASAQEYTFSLEATSDGTTPKTTFDPGEYFFLNIKLNNAAGVAGCAFTLEYPSAVLIPPATNSEGISDGITSDFPFTYNTDQTHLGNSSDPGKIYLAGAAINMTDGGSLYSSGPVTLFTVRFQVKDEATFGSFNVTLKQTELWNLAAGYGTDNNSNGTYDSGIDEMGKVTVLVGAVPNTDSNWADLSLAFPDLMPSPPSPLASTESTPLYASDGDDIDDEWELLYFGDLTTADNTTDSDGDGYLDLYEYLNGTNPTIQDPPDFLNPNYNPATDNRGPYQVVGPDPVQPFAGAGESFDLDVYYFTSDGAQNLSGLTLRIHYDSTKLTWNDFSDILATGLGTPSAAPQDDTSDFDNDSATDKFVVVPWSGGNWPNETCTLEVPLLLFAVNFTVQDGVEEGTTSTINFTATPASGYEFWSPPVEFEARAVEMGDVDGDGVINVFDVIKIARASLGLDVTGPFYEAAADLDGNGVINVFDVIKAARLSLGLD